MRRGGRGGSAFLHTHCSALLCCACWKSSSMSPAPGRAGHSGARFASCLSKLVVPSLPCRSALQRSRRRPSCSSVTPKASASKPAAPCSPTSRRSAKAACGMPILGGVRLVSSTVPPHVVQPSHSVSVSVPSPSRATRRKNCCVLPEAVRPLMARSMAARSVMLAEAAVGTRSFTRRAPRQTSGEEVRATVRRRDTDTSRS